MLEDARNWIKFAAEDLQMADLAFQAGIYNQTCLADTRGEILALDRFYIPTRYPNALPGMLPDGLPNKVDASEAVEVARLVFEKVKAQLGTK